MKVYFTVLVFFLLAFAGLATGLLLKRKGLRGGCSPALGTGRDCRCKSETDPNIKVRVNRGTKEGESQEGKENRPV